MKKINAGKWNELVEEVLAAEIRLESTPWPQDAADWEGQTKRHAAARESLDAARANLRSAMKETAGGQSGCAFITYCSRHGRCNPDTASLWINRRLRASLAPDGRVTVIGKEEAKTARLQTKAAGSLRDREYKELRKELARLLLELDIHEPRDFGEWKFREGQMGGYFYRGNHKDCISADGALKAAWDGTGEMRQMLEFVDRPEVLDAEYRFDGARY